MQDNGKIAACYTITAGKYFEKFSDELYSKFFDRTYLAAFAQRNKDKGLVLDLGCGPGHIAAFLYSNGCTNIVGLDLSKGMIDVAEKAYGHITFLQEDMMALPFDDGSVQAATALYSIIHFDDEGLLIALKEINRVLHPGSDFLVSFHIGNEVIHNTAFLGEKVDIEFHMLEVEGVKSVLQRAGFGFIDIVERYPYPRIEYQSKRAYILAVKQ
jgi:ubiquinone/menaquinone biosynthesis C-methylase UbiE